MKMYLTLYAKKELYKLKLYLDTISHIPTWQKFRNLIMHSIDETVDILLYIIGKIQNGITTVEGNLALVSRTTYLCICPLTQYISHL